MKVNSQFPRECRKCLKVQDEASFASFEQNGVRYHRPNCKSCWQEYDKTVVRNRTHYSQLTEEEKQKQRDLTTRCRNEAKQDGKCVRCYKERGLDGSTSFCSACLVIKNAENKKLFSELRNKVLDHYGRKCSCSGCIETNEGFLTIEHVDGWGKDHRIASGSRMSGLTLMRWIIKNGFPESIAILCYNCNCGSAHRGNGICPHFSEVKSKGAST